MRNLVQFFDIFNLHYLLHYSLLYFRLSLKVVENHLNAVVVVTDDLIGLFGCEVVVNLDNLLDLFQSHPWKLYCFEARQLEGEIALAGYDYVVAGVLLTDEFDFLQWQFI
jgi:hypothetical protein